MRGRSLSCEVALLSEGLTASPSLCYHKSIGGDVMFIYKTGNMFNSDANYFVDPVNTVGTSGKGLALEVKKKYRATLHLIKNSLKRP